MSKRKSNLIEFESCVHSGVSRLEFFNQMARLGAIGAVAGFIPRVLAGPSPDQYAWCFCKKCQSLFYNGYRDKGRCPAKGEHVYSPAANEITNEDYKLTYNSPGPGQLDWRFCNKCKALFWNGYPTKGACGAGGGHTAAGYNFTLRYDARADGQKNWRYCNKCEVLFFDGRPNKGICMAGGTHVAAGFNFVLSYTTYTF